jgi:hypothetical protein
MIDILGRLVSKHCQQLSTVPVIVAAPTGLAAFKVGGTTIHRVLSLPVEHDKPPADYTPLSQEQLTSTRAVLSGLKLLIVDEVSMVSSLTLLFIHLRHNDNLFGGISIVFLRTYALCSYHQ